MCTGQADIERTREALAALCLNVATMLPRRQEQRTTPRYPRRRAGEVIFGALETAVPCVIWDLSDGGARLGVALPLAELPRTFTLSSLKDASVHGKCEVVWTDTRFVGVKFL